MRAICLFALSCMALLAAPAAAETLKVPADFETIGDAVAAAQDGDTISVSKGTYLESVTVSVANVTLVGKGAVIDARYAGPCLELLADGISVKSFTLVNGTVGVLASGADISISKCSVFSCAGNGIEAEGAPTTISKNTVIGCNLAGIQYLHSLPGASLIEKNTCASNGSHGIIVTGDDTELTRNDCRRNEGSGISASIEGLAPLGEPLAPPVLFLKNDCRENEDHGLTIENTTASPVTIEDNDLSGNCDHGLDADGNGYVITRNDCKDNMDDGLHLLVGGSEVSKNSAWGNEGQGLFVSNDLTVEAPGDGGGGGGGGGTGDDNVITGNSCKDNAGDGIQVKAGHANSLVDNTCTSNLDDGIDIDETAATDTVLDDNTCSENGHEGIDNQGTASDITGNTCKKNGHGSGPDLAGLGDGGLGSVDAFADNVFDTGGEGEPSSLDDGVATGL